MSSKKQKAFTLIELLVVIAIIALLASIVLVALNGARVKARDATRIADLTEIQTALELYFNDNGSYPNTNCGSDGTGACWSTFLPMTYIASMPNDPLNTSGYGLFYSTNYKPISACAYQATGSTNDYILATRLESPTSIPNSCPSGFGGWDNGALNYLIGE